ncbi:MAG: hypothetical protein ACRCU2_02020, partial [Planktothrix sp.]
TRSESVVNFIYKNTSLINEVVYYMNSESRVETYETVTIETDNTEKTDTVIYDPHRGLYTPYNDGYNRGYALYGVNDDRTKSFGVYTEGVNINEYRLYSRDLTYKSMPIADFPEEIDLYNWGWNWIGDKLYVADAWINDVNDEFYHAGSYMGADMDSMGGNEPYPKWDTKTPVIIRVYEFKDHPTEANQFIIEQVDAFLFDAERITPEGYDYTDTGSDGRPPEDPRNPLYYYPVALSYHPG